MTTEKGNEGSAQSLEAAAQSVVDTPLSDVLSPGLAPEAITQAAPPATGPHGP